MSDVGPRARSAVEVLRRLQTAMGNAEVALAHRMDMGPRDLTALTHIAFSRAAVTPSEVGERLGVTRGAVTELVDRLERVGHVQRRRDDADRRRVELHLTESAREEVREHLDDLITDLGRAFDGLSSEELDTVQTVLERLVEAYDRFAHAER